VQLILAPQENQAFRADLAKLLVHRRARGRGLGTALMRAAEEEARRIGRTLLTLDTETGSAADRLYQRLGWTKYGEVPGYAMNADNSRREAVSFFYKTL
jgi:GNAT superfamily N-acetyltransferase